MSIHLENTLPLQETQGKSSTWGVQNFNALAYLICFANSRQ